jgi:hypothetical protein
VKTREPLIEQPMTLADVDAALEAHEITPATAYDLRAKIRLRDHSLRFKAAAERVA